MGYQVLEVIVTAIEVVAVAILAIGLAVVLGRGVLHRLRGRPWETVFIETRIGLGRVLLLGLEVLIAADIIFTVVLELTLENIAALGLLVLIRTFLSWAIEVENDGHWPWNMADKRAEERRIVERARLVPPTPIDDE
jgi:uncharacterized membrane protein